MERERDGLISFSIISDLRIRSVEGVKVRVRARSWFLALTLTLTSFASRF